MLALHCNLTSPIAQKRNSERRGGFTLVELMVVIAIIAVLAAIIMPVFSRARETARQTTCRNNLHSIGIALRNYLTDEGMFPLPYNPYNGTGGVSQLYLSGYLGSTVVLRCPNDTTRLTDYNAAHSTLAGWSNWDKERFDERYSSYNEYFTASNLADPMYNYYGYRGYSGCDGTSANGNFIEVPAGTSWGPTDVADGFATPEDWLYTVYRDSNHPNYELLAGDTLGRVFDRAGAATNEYARPLLSGTTDQTTAYFPGLVNSNAPDTTIVTHCPWHRSWAGRVQEQKDIVVRVDGSTDEVFVHAYDWVAQRAQ